MAKEVDDGVFWLPSEFLTEDDLLMDFKTDGFLEKTNDDVSSGLWNSFGFNSELSSPVESVVCSTETESDEDEFITGLTQKMANLSPHQPQKGWEMSGSPQSTLPVCKSLYAGDAARLNLLYAAAGEVARRRMIDEATAFYSADIFAQTSKRTLIANQNSAIDFNGNQNEAQVSYRQQLARQIQHVKHQEMMKNGAYGPGKIGYLYRNGMKNGVSGRTQSSSMVAGWPTPQQSRQQQNKPGSAYRAVFLGVNGMKKERTGTGVFLPRRSGATVPTETRKKPAARPVLLPDKVFHALNLESMESPSQPRTCRNLTAENDVALKHGKNVMIAEQRRNQRPKQQPVMMVNQELRLPQEWTY